MDVIQLFFEWLGVDFPVVAAAAAIALPAVAWLKERMTLPDLTLWKLVLKGNTLLTLIVSLGVGGYGQYQALGWAWAAVLGGGLLTYLVAAGLYDLTIGALRKK